MIAICRTPHPNTSISSFSVRTICNRNRGIAQGFSEIFHQPAAGRGV
jgi:hypothetical protein